MKKISVIVPVYNVSAYLPRCLESLVAQTLTEYEVILVNDGSTDASGEICQTYADKYPALIQYYEKENGGLSDARNYGLPYATGQYVLFIDSDDYVEPEMLARMYAKSQAGQKKIVECNFFWEYETKKRADIIKSYASLKDYLVKGRVVAWNKLYLRDWLLATKVKFPVGLLYEDQEFFFKLVTYLTDISEVALDPVCEVHYVQRGDSISYRETTRVQEIFTIYADILSFYEQRGCLAKYRSELEYRFSRNLLGNVLVRKVLKIKDKALRRQLLDQIKQTLRHDFPKYKHNPYLKTRSKVNLYLRVVDPLLFKLFYII